MENVDIGYFLEMQGDLWEYNHDITDKETKEPMDCSGLHALMVIKRIESPTAPVIAKSYIDWENQSEGKGAYKFLPEITKDITPSTYFYQCYLFNEDYTFAETLERGEIKVLPTLKAPLKPEEE